MASAKKDNVFAVLSLSGGNDGLNTVIPYTSGLYRDYRPKLGIPAGQSHPLERRIGPLPHHGALEDVLGRG